MDTRSMILDALQAFAAQRPGLDFGNYGDVSAYRSEVRSITKDLHQFRTLLSAVRWRSGITADDLVAASKSAYSGRLTINVEAERVTVDYCTGQYFPTEYRRAACAVLASALWAYTRADMTEKPGERIGDRIRNQFRREFGPAMQKRWFD